MPLLTLWGEWLFLPASASREIEVSFFFLLPNNFLKGWNLPPFFLSADYRINTCCGLTGLHPGASEQITAELPRPRELGQRAAITGKGRPSLCQECQGLPCPRTVRRRQAGAQCVSAPGSQEAPGTAPRGSKLQGVAPLAQATQRWSLLSLTKQVARALLHGRS